MVFSSPPATIIVLQILDIICFPSLVYFPMENFVFLSSCLIQIALLFFLHITSSIWRRLLPWLSSALLVLIESALLSHLSSSFWRPSILLSSLLTTPIFYSWKNYSKPFTAASLLWHLVLWMFRNWFTNFSHMGLSTPHFFKTKHMHPFRTFSHWIDFHINSNCNMVRPIARKVTHPNRV